MKAYNDFMELKKIKEYGKKYDAEHFKKYSDLRINRKTAKNIMYQHTLNDLKKLREGIENFDKLPEVKKILKSSFQCKYQRIRMII